MPEALPTIDFKASATMSLTNLDTQETKQMVYNPTDLDVILGINWTKHEVVGLPYTPLQYAGTDNIGVSFTMRFIPDTLKEYEEYRDTLNFLLALGYPFEDGGSPPDVLLTWPNFITLVCKVDSISLKPQHYNAEAVPVVMEVPIKVQNVRRVRMLYSEVRERGLQQYRA